MMKADIFYEKRLFMIHIFKRAAALALAALLLTPVLTGCKDEDSPSPAPSSQTEETTEGAVTTDADLHSLINIDYDGNDFAGVWIITEGVGSKLDGFAFMFDGIETAYLMVGTMGYIGTYTMQTETVNGASQKTFTTQLMFGLDGKYTYEFENDKQDVTLTNIDTGDTTQMKRAAAYEYIPYPDEFPVIDEQLVGAWSDDNGNMYYFDMSGIMYEYEKGMSFTFSKYSANGENLSYTYIMQDEINGEAQYSVHGDSLTIDDLQYHRVSAAEL